MHGVINLFQNKVQIQLYLSVELSEKNASHLLCVYASAPERQVLELHLLQVHFHLWRIERADSGGGGHVVFVVLCLGLSPPHGAALQRPI